MSELAPCPSVSVFSGCLVTGSGSNLASSPLISGCCSESSSGTESGTEVFTGSGLGGGGGEGDARCGSASSFGSRSFFAWD